MQLMFCDVEGRDKQADPRAIFLAKMEQIATWIITRSDLTALAPRIFGARTEAYR
ncbi:hypothetical protein [Xanthomonas vasicola]|uniref:hypothetical protein n=1 Tax=Xanthomonas vasicola TaxID=56459 RepID=UPI0012D934D0|nr:hypothetical protein [Xanthomonas vasicola]